MSVCAMCGGGLSDDAGLCPYHVAPGETAWSAANRIMCDFFHRQIEPRRLALRERDEDYQLAAAGDA